MVTERQVMERQFQVLECQTQVVERRSSPFQLNLITVIQLAVSVSILIVHSL